MCPLSISFSLSQALQSLVAKSIYFPPLLTHIPNCQGLTKKTFLKEIVQLHGHDTMTEP